MTVPTVSAEGSWHKTPAARTSIADPGFADNCHLHHDLLDKDVDLHTGNRIDAFAEPASLRQRGWAAPVFENRHGENTVRAVFIACLATTAALLASCGPSPEEQAAAAAAQHAADQNKCYGYGFQPGSDAFAHCMMTTATQRDAQQAADRRMAAAQQAATDRQNAAIKADKDAADKDAWDRRTGQGAYANSPSTTPAYSPPQQPASSLSSNPVDKVRDSIQNDMDKMENAGTVSP